MARLFSIIFVLLLISCNPVYADYTPPVVIKSYSYYGSVTASSHTELCQNAMPFVSAYHNFDATNPLHTVALCTINTTPTNTSTSSFVTIGGSYRYAPQNFTTTQYVIGTRSQDCSPNTRKSGVLPNVICNGTDPTPPPCQAGPYGYAGIPQAAGWYSNPTTSNTTKTACQGGCQLRISPNNDWHAIQFSDGSASLAGDLNYTGENCSGGASPDQLPPKTDLPPTLKDCSDQGKAYGEINGLGVCVPVGTPGSTPVIPQDKTTTINNTTTNTTENNTTTNNTTNNTTTNAVFNNNGTVTTTTTGETANSDGSTQQTTESKTQPIAEYCQENPQDKFCKGRDSSTFIGSCSNGASAIVCDGDAIQCAIAKKQHESRCQDLQTNSTTDLGDRLLSGSTTAADLGGNDTFSSPMQINVGNLDTTSILPKGCLADLTFQVINQTVTLPLSQLCDGLQAAGKIVLAFAYMIAARIIFS